MNCKNCGNIVEGEYCNHCGQRSNVGRITLSSLLNELTESIFQIDRGFFYTLTQLFARPGKSIREYLNGKRRKHFKPIAAKLDEFFKSLHESNIEDKDNKPKPPFG